MSDFHRRKLRLVIIGFLLLTVAGCSAPAQSVDRSLQRFVRSPMQQSRISCFLTLKTADSIPMRLNVTRLELLVGDTWLPIMSNPKIFDSTELGDGQLFIGAQNVPPGDYRRMRIEVSRAEVLGAGRFLIESSKEPQWYEVGLVQPLILALDDSKTLLLSWDVDGSIDQERHFFPEISARSTRPQIWSDLVIVSCPEVDTVFIMRADNNQVVSSFGLQGAPTYMAIDSNNGKRQLIVLCSRDRMVKVVDLETFRVVEFFSVPLNDNPKHMLLSDAGDSLYLVDDQSGYLTRLDLDTGEILSRSFLDFRPQFLYYLSEQNLLAVSLSLSQKVLLLDPVSLGILAVFSTGNRPAGLLNVDDKLYVAESGDNRIGIIDLSSRTEQYHLPVGLGPLRLISDEQQIYVGNAIDGSLSVLDARGFGVIQKIYGIGRPGEMVLNHFYKRIYVTDEENDALSIVDANTNKVIKRIELGALPFGLVVVE